jgi:hypothetical protein
MMVAEMAERDAKKAGFSRRRKHYDERDVDSINGRNAHFNRKIGTQSLPARERLSACG